MKRASIDLTTCNDDAPPDRKRQRRLVQSQLMLTAHGPAIVPITSSETRATEISPRLLARMHDAIETQLSDFFLCTPSPVCAFGGAEHNSALRVCHFVHYFGELCRDFLQDKRPDDPGFLDAWQQYHATNARLRILCKDCAWMVEPRLKSSRSGGGGGFAPKKPPRSINDVLAPRKQSARQAPVHPWLSLASWPEPNARGNYSRQLGPNRLTLFRRGEKWLCVYRDVFHKTTYDSVEEALGATYSLFKDDILRYV